MSADDERARYLAIIAAESERLAEMSGNALMMTKLESQSFVMDGASYALDEQIRQCVILLSQQWAKKGLDVSAELESATYFGSADSMRQVWINIIGNAIKFAPEGGKEELARAFEKYYQGNSSHAAKGLGLGLAIAKRIVELSGGRIEAGNAPGGGCVLTVSLPSSPRS